MVLKDCPEIITNRDAAYRNENIILRVSSVNYIILHHNMLNPLLLR